MNNDPAGGTLYLSISVCRGDVLLLYHLRGYTGAIMAAHEVAPTPDGRSIAEAGERQHRTNINAELARRDEAALPQPEAIFPGAGFVDDEFAALEILAIEATDRGFHALGIGHGDEGESARAVRFAVHHDGDIADGTVLTEGFAEVCFGDRVGKVPHIHFVTHVILVARRTSAFLRLSPWIGSKKSPPNRILNLMTLPCLELIKRRRANRTIGRIRETTRLFTTFVK